MSTIPNDATLALDTVTRLEARIDALEQRVIARDKIINDMQRKVAHARNQLQEARTAAGLDQPAPAPPPPVV